MPSVANRGEIRKDLLLRLNDNCYGLLTSGASHSSTFLGLYLYSGEGSLSDATDIDFQNGELFRIRSFAQAVRSRST